MSVKLKTWVQNWIDDLTKPSPNNNEIPLCPFAKKAWQQKAVKVVNSKDIWTTVCKEVNVFGSHKVVMCVDENPEYTYSELEAGCDALNYWFASIKKDVWLLSYQTDRAVVFIQPLSDLDNASITLEKLGYYTNYKQKDYNRLIKHRRDLRGVY